MKHLNIRDILSNDFISINPLHIATYTQEPDGTFRIRTSAGRWIFTDTPLFVNGEGFWDSAESEPLFPAEAKLFNETPQPPEDKGILPDGEAEDPEGEV